MQISLKKNLKTIWSRKILSRKIWSRKNLDNPRARAHLLQRDRRDLIRLQTRAQLPLDARHELRLRGQLRIARSEYGRDLIPDSTHNNAHSQCDRGRNGQSDEKMIQSVKNACI